MFMVMVRDVILSFCVVAFLESLDRCFCLLFCCQVFFVFECSKEDGEDGRGGVAVFRRMDKNESDSDDRCNVLL